VLVNTSCTSRKTLGFKHSTDSVGDTCRMTTRASDPELSFNCVGFPPAPKKYQVFTRSESGPK